MDENYLRTIVVTVVAEVVALVSFHFIGKFPMIDMLTLMALIFLVILVVDFRLTLGRGMRGTLAMNEVVVRALTNVADGILEISSGKKITSEILQDKIVVPLSQIRGAEAYRKVYHSSGSNDPNRSRKERLLEKAHREEISLDEARELKGLLEKEREEHRREGNILRAIIIGAIILFILGLIAKLLAEE